MGFKISPAIGLVMSELLLDGKGKSGRYQFRSVPAGLRKAAHQS